MQAFAAAMLKFVKQPSLSATMGIAGRERVRKIFSREAFARSLDNTCTELVKRGSPHADKAGVAWGLFLNYLLIFIIVPCAAVVFAAMRWTV